MARPLRVNVERGWYHAMHRGIQRSVIFQDDGDRRHFLKLIGELEEELEIQVHGYCVMDNHYHLILHTPRGNLSQGMKWLGQSYAGWYNRRHGRVGPVFQGRFKSSPVAPDGWLLELSLYIHLNPIRTSIFGLSKRLNRAEALGAGEAPTPEELSRRMRHLRQYRWSSFRAYAGYEKGPEWLHRGVILCRTGKPGRESVERYREWCRRALKRGIEETQFEKFRDTLALGGARFVEAIRKRVGKVSREVEGRHRLRARLTWKEVVAAVESVRGEKAGEWMDRHGDPGKWLVAMLARKHCGMTLAQVGEAMSGRDYVAVAMGIKRLETRLLKSAKLRNELERAVKMLIVKT